MKIRVSTKPRSAQFFCRALVVGGLFLASFSGHANTGAAPDPLAARTALEQVAAEMVTALQDPSVRTDVHKMRELVDRVLVPQIDFRTSSNLVLGAHWKEASEAQREAFMAEFQAFLVRFYTSALASYVDSEEVPIDIMSFNEEPRSKGERQVFVLSHVGQPGGEPVAVEYRMYWSDAWKVIDVSVDGISMVQTYRSNFTSTVKREGLDTLIAQLRERNETLAVD